MKDTATSSWPNQSIVETWQAAMVEQQAVARLRADAAEVVWQTVMEMPAYLRKSAGDKAHIEALRLKMVALRAEADKLAAAPWLWVTSKTTVLDGGVRASVLLVGEA